MKKSLLLLFFAFIISLSAARERQHLIFENTFEEPHAMQTWKGFEEASKSSITILDSVARHESYSLKFVLNKTDSYVVNGKRAEVTLKPEQNVKVERWVEFSFFLPASFIQAPEPDIIQQWHKQ